MLIGLGVRDVVLIERLDLAFGPGLTALTGETGAGKSIILDALGLATGRRADAGLVRQGAEQASATAIFAPGPGHPAWSVLEERGLDYIPDEDLVLRRTLAADGRSRAFVNDQPATVAVLRELGALLLEVHGQHETVGLLDAATHRPVLDSFGALGPELTACAEAWSVWRAARERAQSLADAAGRSVEEAAELSQRLAELDRLDPRDDEEVDLAGERALLGAAEKTIADIAAAADGFGSGSVAHRLGQSLRALERAKERAINSGVDPESRALQLLAGAIEAAERALSEIAEAESAVDAAAQAFEFEPDRLEKVEERLFALRGAARKLGVTVADLPAARIEIAARLQAIESGEESLEAANAAAAQAKAAYVARAAALTVARRATGDRLAAAVEAELAPLKLEKARFRVAVDPATEDRAGPSGADRIQFEIATNPGAPFGALGAIASGGELSRLALALKVALASRGGEQPLMIFDEVDQGVGGAVADAVGQRLKRLASQAQLLVVTHSPQIAARADSHWRVIKLGEGAKVRTDVEVLTPAAREEEIARMLSGAEITEAARAAARALMHA
jgi:DNA repair protein RecN (Recombination protein N)